MSMSFDGILASTEFFANPYPVYQLLREQAPVYWSDYWQAWILTRYADVHAVLHNPQQFSNVGRINILLNHLPDKLHAKTERLTKAFAVGLVNSDSPDHGRLRTLIGKAFTATLVNQYRARVQSLLNELLENLPPSGQFDIVNDLAYPLPATIISEILGIPPEDRDQFKQWSIDIFKFLGGISRATPERVENAHASQVALEQYVMWLAEKRRQLPKDDIISYLVSAEDQGDKLSQQEFLAFCSTFLSAGHETTTNLIANGLLLLLQNPDQLELLRKTPSLIDTAVEEFLRFESPLQRDPRRIIVDTEIDGYQFKAEQIPMLGAANHDPAQFPNPEKLDITRPKSRHLAFGFGIHFCIGAPLARMEAQLAITSVLNRLPNLRLVEDKPDWNHDIALRGLRKLLVEY